MSATAVEPVAESAASVLDVPPGVLWLATAAAESESPRYDIQTVQFGRDAESAFAVATDCMQMMIARWGWGDGPEVPAFRVPADALLRLAHESHRKLSPAVSVESDTAGWRVRLSHDRCELLESGVTRDGRFPPVWYFDKAIRGEPSVPGEGSRYAQVRLERTIYKTAARVGRSWSRHWFISHPEKDDPFTTGRPPLHCWEFGPVKEWPQGLRLWATLMPMLVREYKR